MNFGLLIGSLVGAAVLCAFARGGAQVRQRARDNDALARWEAEGGSPPGQPQQTPAEPVSS